MASSGPSGSGAPSKMPVPPPNGLVDCRDDPERFIRVPMSGHPLVGKPQQPDEEPSRAAEGDDRALYIGSINTCTAIAISGVYPAQDAADPPIQRYDRFMIHVAEENWWHHFDKLQLRVQEAQEAGLSDLQIHVAAVRPETLLLDDGFQDEDPVGDSYVEQRKLMTKLRELVGSDAQSNDQPRIHWYPYRYGGYRHNTIMAFYSDRSVVVNQEAFKCAWQLQEKEWMNYMESSIPEETPSPDDYKTRVNQPWIMAKSQTNGQS
ncbi:hypothetical protein PG985_014283 [Apiospora marii]|uniref:Uncharacterized protein n=1 Tax=Apiospora marii TaxID=335849 RepID=A0ABR1R5R0_9PEZI